jgi:hypothetical protein
VGCSATCQDEFATIADSHLIPVIPQAHDAKVVAMHVHVVFILRSPVHSADKAGEKGAGRGGGIMFIPVCKCGENTYMQKVYIYMYPVCIYIYKAMGVYIYISVHIYIYETGI